MVDPATGTFRIRSTGRPRAGSKLRRSVIASFRRKSFLDFLYFTDFETTDPINYTATYQCWANTNCGSGRYRPQRATSGGPGDDGCIEIQFADADAITGPFHTNDSILTCGTPDFGRVGKADSIEFTPTVNPWTSSAGSCPAGAAELQDHAPHRRHEAHDADDQRHAARRSPQPTASSTPAGPRSASTPRRTT